MYGRARRLLVERTPEHFLDELEKALGPLADRVRVAPEDMRQTKWDAMSRLTPLPARAARGRRRSGSPTSSRPESSSSSSSRIFDLRVGRARRLRGPPARPGPRRQTRLAAEIFPAAESLAARAAFERFSWIVRARGGQPAAGERAHLPERQPAPDRAARSTPSPALGEESRAARRFRSRGSCSTSSRSRRCRRRAELATALTVPRDLGAVIALDDVTSGLRNAAVLPRPAARVDQGGQRGDARASRQDPRRRAILKFLADLAQGVLVPTSSPRGSSRPRTWTSARRRASAPRRATSWRGPRPSRRTPRPSSGVAGLASRRPSRRDGR